MTELRLHTVLEPMGPAGAIVLSDEQVATLSTAKAFPVAVRIGERVAKLRLSRMGGKNLIGFSKAVRAEMAVELGDEFDAVIAADTAERTVDIPDALATALASDPAARTAFDALSYSRRKEIARSIADAKQDATRERRLEKALADLRG
ncbi:YdeI/OmpD-associated family protein [Microbacterium sp. H1-D42]|uniref:YdeI/OmpD-associated family protein n=1 Tax=Microbacterium sp. H1-D42 TaxID=2925844 RepID=UPI001F5370E1|nr:YdeI/OmpD-associated family protein [Microbacterium sp. H1-D42]UNK71302.1 YdeI/OmpD-associated family protein [Microbacterium sp. H1-D42]